MCGAPGGVRTEGRTPAGRGFEEEAQRALQGRHSLTVGAEGGGGGRGGARGGGGAGRGRPGGRGGGDRAGGGGGGGGGGGEWALQFAQRPLESELED